MAPVSPAWSRFLVDEDLPRSLAADFRDAGLDAVHAVDVALGGRSDALVRELAAASSRILVTRDVGMVAPRDPGSRSVPGFVLVRVPTAVLVADLKVIIVRALLSLSKAPPSDPIVVVEPGRVRIRRRPSP
jgi:predicted nuclease of predicted toxin-antitoxin system